MQEKEIMPARKIETLSTGTFFGRVADTHSDKIERKLFCGEIQIDNKAVAAEKKKWVDIPVMTDFGSAYIRRKITENPEEYIKDQIRYEFKTSSVLYNPADLDEDVNDKYNKLDAAERNRLLEEIIQFKLNLLMEDIIEKNYQRIKDEAADLVNRAWENDGIEKPVEGKGSPGKAGDALSEPIMVDPFDGV